MPSGCCCCMSSLVGAAAIEKPALARLNKAVPLSGQSPLQGWGQTTVASLQGKRRSMSTAIVQHAVERPSDLLQALPGTLPPLLQLTCCSCVLGRVSG